MGIENIKYCKECGRAFDVGTNYDLCPDCRHRFGIQNKREVIWDERGITKRD